MPKSLGEKVPFYHQVDKPGTQQPILTQPTQKDPMRYPMPPECDEVDSTDCLMWNILAKNIKSESDQGCGSKYQFMRTIRDSGIHQKIQQR